MFFIPYWARTNASGLHAGALTYWANGTMVEKTGFEPATSCLQGRRSPNWATTPYRNLFMYWWSCQPPTIWFYLVLDQSIIENQATYTQLPEQAPTEVWTPPHFRSDNAICCSNRSPIASLLLVRDVGLEPTHLAILDPKSSASANSANPGYVWL